MLRRNIAPDDVPAADMKQPATQEFAIMLQPVSHPELSAIRIDENLFAVGRTEPPFDGYPPELVADLSRRHARLFAERGAVYLADLESKNGTSVNGVGIRQKTVLLHDGDQICFAGTLCYRLQLGTRAAMPVPAAKLVSLTLQPERDDLGLQPIVVTSFPFLISKIDPAFARYKDAHPHQVNYLSRRHAHIFLKGGAPFVEDLGSTNGTFVAGKRLDEHAVPLHEGDTLAFGGHHFVYRLSLQQEQPCSDPTVTRLSPAVRRSDAADADKTTFVAAADSFLDIFCIDHAQQPDELNEEAAKPPGDAQDGTGKRRVRARWGVFLSELTQAFADGDRAGRKRLTRWGAVLVMLVGIFAASLYLRSEPQDRLKELLASGDYARAAAVADSYLQRDPDNGELRELATDAQLKANVPRWLAMLQAREFDHASAVLAAMKQSGRHDPDLRPLVSELEWMDALERFVVSRGGSEAPIRIYRDEDKVKTLVSQWEQDPRGHQSALAAIASAVPAFRDRYAEALSHLRKLQSDEAVYLGAIERLKTEIGTGLNDDRPEAVAAALKDYAEKYPRIGGLENVRQDLRQYTAMLGAARERNLGQLVALLAKTRFVTPPFQERFRAVKSGKLLPPADVIQQYQTVSDAWNSGDTNRTFAGLQKMAAGSWGDAAAAELARKKVIVDQFSALQKARGSNGYEDQLLAFYGSLDPDQDTYFIHATQADVNRYKPEALGRAQELLKRAQMQWHKYQESGAIDGSQRLESKVSSGFQTQARLLAGAQLEARQGVRIYRQLKQEPPAEWSKLQQDIDAEQESQRKSLLELRDVLEPRLLKEKLALFGEPGAGN